MRLPVLAVFDVDGTLVDSRAALHAGTVAAFETAGLKPPSFERSRRVVGLSFEEGLRVLAPEHDAPTIARLTDAYQAIFVAMHADPEFFEPMYVGAAELLDRLRLDGWRIAMATGRSRKGVEVVMKMHGWVDHFDSTHCASDGPGKPHPAMVQAAMQALDVPPERTVVIGDTAFDMTMAKSAGARAQGVSWGFHTAEEITAGGADHVAHTMEELDVQLDLFRAARDCDDRDDGRHFQPVD